MIYKAPVAIRQPLNFDVDISANQVGERPIRTEIHVEMPHMVLGIDCRGPKPHDITSTTPLQSRMNGGLAGRRTYPAYPAMIS